LTKTDFQKIKDILRMKKVFLVALTLLAGSAWAEWVKMGETDEGSLYIDAASVQREGQFRQVLELMDLKQRDEGGELSRRIRVQYDCALGLTKVLSISTHVEAMGTGKALVAVAREGLRKEVPPGTAYETSFKLLCAK
jgi:hypothetical protein